MRQPVGGEEDGIAATTPQPVVLHKTSILGSLRPARKLSLLLPQDQPGCNLLVAPDLLEFVFASAGAAEVQVPLPNTTAVIGQVVHQQLIPFEVDALLERHRDHGDEHAATDHRLAVAVAASPDRHTRSRR